MEWQHWFDYGKARREGDILELHLRHLDCCPKCGDYQRLYESCAEAGTVMSVYCCTRCGHAWGEWVATLEPVSPAADWDGSVRATPEAGELAREHGLVGPAGVIMRRISEELKGLMLRVSWDASLGTGDTLSLSARIESEIRLGPKQRELTESFIRDVIDEVLNEDGVPEISVDYRLSPGVLVGFWPE